MESRVDEASSSALPHSGAEDIGYHMVVPRVQTLVQLTDELVARLDERAARERRSRSTLVRDALEQYLSSELDAEIDRRIVDGYRRIPQTAEEDRWAYGAAREAIDAERW
jgi:predicted transcriptional regulator